MNTMFFLSSLSWTTIIMQAFEITAAREFALARANPKELVFKSNTHSEQQQMNGYVDA